MYNTLNKTVGLLVIVLLKTEAFLLKFCLNEYSCYSRKKNKD